MWFTFFTGENDVEPSNLGDQYIQNSVMACFWSLGVEVLNVLGPQFVVLVQPDTPNSTPILILPGFPKLGYPQSSILDWDFPVSSSDKGGTP